MSKENPSPLEQLQSDINNVGYELRNLHGKVRLTNLRDRVEDLNTQVRGLPQRIQVLRDRSYAFEKNLEERAADLLKRWNATMPAVERRMNIDIPALERQIPALETQFQRLNGLSRNPIAARPVLQQVQAQVDNLESKAGSLENAIRGMFDTIENEFNAFKTHLAQLEAACDYIDAACFQLYPSEAVVTAVKAVWYRDTTEEKNDPDGILYLTDQRLIFEQNEEVATKKVLFITTESKKVQTLQFEVPVSLVSEVKAFKKGFLKNEDHIEIQFNPGAPFHSAFLHIFDQDCESWQGLINLVRCGDIQKSRAIAIDQTLVEKAKAAPTQCPSCGGAITQPVIRGADSITCPYCGLVIRL